MKFVYSKNPQLLHNFILGALNPVKKPPVFSLYGGWKKPGFAEDLTVKKKLRCQSRNLVICPEYKNSHYAEYFTQARKIAPTALYCWFYHKNIPDIQSQYRTEKLT